MLTDLPAYVVLAPPACLLLGVAAGAWGAYRLGRGLSPLPNLIPQRVRHVPAAKPDPAKPVPKVYA